MIIVFDSNDFLYDLFSQAKEHGQNRDALIAPIDACQVATVTFQQPNAQQG